MSRAYGAGVASVERGFMDILNKKVAAMRGLLNSEIENVSGGLRDCRESQSRVTESIDGVVIRDETINDDVVCDP